MSSCDNKPADSLVAGTFLGVDCEGLPVGAGASIATCRDLQIVRGEIPEIPEPTPPYDDSAIKKSIEDEKDARQKADDDLQEEINNLPDEKFISEHSVINNKLVSTYNTGDTIEVDLPAQETGFGLDCEAISELEERGWSGGTTLLAQSTEGECYRLGNIARLFQEVGVGIGYAPLRQEVGSAIELTYTVTNTGSNIVDTSDLTITIPENTGDYSFSIVEILDAGIDGYERIDDLNYIINGMAAGATFVVKAKIIGNASGTYQTTAQVATDAPFEQDITNNIDTVIANFYSSESNYVPTIDCPLIVATDVETGEVLNTFGLGQTARDIIPGRANIYINRDSLAGLKIKLSGASTVVSNVSKITDEDVLSENFAQLGVTSSSFGYIKVGMLNLQASNIRESAWYSESLKRVMPDAVEVVKRIDDDTLTSPEGDGLVTFDATTEVATFADDPELRAGVIFMRPAGSTCKWQAIYISSTTDLPIPASCRTLQKVSGSDVISYEYVESGDMQKIFELIDVPTTKYIGGSNPGDWIAISDKYAGLEKLNGYKVPTITHSAGTESVVTLQDTCGDAKSYITSGKVSTSWDEATTTLTINISVNAEATDSQSWDFLKIDIE